MNAVLKYKVNFKKSELPLFIDKVREIVLEQQKEVELAVINRGKYQFRTQYSFLQVEEDKWFKMNAQQRAKHLSKVNSLVLSETKQHRKEEAASVDVSRLGATAESGKQL